MPRSISNGQKLCNDLFDLVFAGVPYEDEASPHFLQGLRYDRLYKPHPKIWFAIELDGEQHYQYIPGLHRSKEDFLHSLANDTAKNQLTQQYLGHLPFRLTVADLTEANFKQFVRQMIRFVKEECRKRGPECADTLQRFSMIEAKLYRLQIPQELLDQQERQLRARNNRMRRLFQEDKPKRYRKPGFINLLRRQFGSGGWR